MLYFDCEHKAEWFDPKTGLRFFQELMLHIKKLNAEQIAITRLWHSWDLALGLLKISDYWPCWQLACVCLSFFPQMSPNAFLSNFRHRHKVLNAKKSILYKITHECRYPVGYREFSVKTIYVNSLSYSCWYQTILYWTRILRSSTPIASD